MNPEQEKIILEKANFRCAKCNFYSPVGKNLEIINNHVLCSICSVFAPENPERLQEYLHEKIDWQNLETFRRFGINKSSHDVHKKGMINKANQGKLMARPPFGYKVENGNLIVDYENSENVRLIFKEFTEGKSLNQISKIYGISVNGVKKILRNFTYLGKIKFAGNIVQGSHPALISSELFNSVQNKLEYANKIRNNQDNINQ
jgi:hypothetical protein